MIDIVEASFVTSAQNIRQVVPEEILEVAFLGRSNVGKSSLINALANHKNLAKSSSTPGKTRLINFFRVKFKINDLKKEAYFVDLPGFGYAKVSKSTKEQWQKNLTEFIQKRLCVRIFLMLIDSRHVDLQIDKEVLDFLRSILRGDQQILIVCTKIDKLKQNDIAKLKRQFSDANLVSVSNKKGINELRDKIFWTLFGENIAPKQ